MASDLKLYRNREQTYIKHKFLTKYLQAAAYKTLHGYPAFNFVDAFAGPWNVSDEEDYSDASFHQAINTLEAVRKDLQGRGNGALKLRFYFCERRTDAVERLREYAKKHNNYNIRVFPGAFEDNLDAISASIPDGFTFTFIDPTGWDIRNEDVFKFLLKHKGEFLLNFMSDHINRHAEYEKVSAAYGRFLADPEWGTEFAQLPGDWNNEKRILHLLKEKMKEAKVATYLPDFPILMPAKERLKMRLILGTHSAKGLEVFRNVQEKVERDEIAIRNSIRDNHSSQMGLFSDDYIAEIQQKREGVGCAKYLDQAKDEIMETLRSYGASKFAELSSGLMDKFPIRLTQTKSLLRKMKDEGLVDFTLPPRKRVPRDDTRVVLAPENNNRS
ncbi:MAG: three-Cys-motif partner protein TcmP [Roseicyclus sp.]|nr:three-Cys-motif partner protein TcmP [Roseicyclus sp.]